MRVKFPTGEQRKFLNMIISKTNSPSLRGLIQFGFDVKYSALKNYYNELRLLPKKIFEEMCSVAGLDPKFFDIVLFDNNWGKVKGGKMSH
ncbi:MAG: hypothetical protein WC548_03040 [Candidatus Pacearchaeota archaeon]